MKDINKNKTIRIETIHSPPHQRSVALREQEGARHSGMSRTPIARAFEVIAYKKQYEAKHGGTLSSQALGHLYETKANFNELSEPVSKTFVEAALTCYNRALNIPCIRAVLLTMESKYGVKNPFQSIFTLEALVRRCERQEFIEWGVASIEHQLMAKYALPGEINSKTITGKNQGGKGIADRCNLRRSFGQLIASSYATKFDNETREVIRKMSMSHADYYTLFGTPVNSHKHDISWISLLPLSGQMLVRFMEVSLHPKKNSALCGPPMFS